MTMKGNDRTSQFLAAMNKGNTDEPQPPIKPVTVSVEPPAPATPSPVVHQMPQAKKAARKAKPPSRADLKHFGGYLDDDTLEKIALLRIRLKMDNSALIKHAIEELHRKHSAKRAFGDA
jgi:hypothetical protein